MAPDYQTLLLAIGLAGFCLSATLFASWMSARVERFLLSWSIGIGCIVPAVAVYSLYIDQANVAIGCLAFTLQFLGFAFIYGAAYRFRSGASARRRIATVFAACLAIALPPLVAGYDGIAFIALNLLITACLAATAREYWRGRAEAPLPLTGIVILYLLTAVSFLLCAGVLIHDGRWVMGHAPDNWAENLNLVAAIMGITGIGAMSLALNQWRVAGSHRHAAMTDALTGLLNRRALFDRYGALPVGEHQAAIAFDLDNFKAVNDRHGHAAGDAVLMVFADILRDSCGVAACLARLGGEEFVVVLERTLPERAQRIAERVREDFAAKLIPIGGRSITCTVSAGIALAGENGTSFDSLLSNADEALYMSKRNGRNRVSLAA
ncbi:diguanylate cyclase [Shinella sp. JR1-6]|jgi:diguanylate cyclase (GGDEF)-like protein|uniref:GGDEF domain-containing protein n=1 Tax=Shinella sp. JR1-6 TaxID=2527671 RepID=UPI00102D3C32|nr:GGDEF domain-containing protein [Shinella sp. JR1-6]TAA63445.1 GGDEF domain-containing protein [Shinella sp. JR1-6]